MEPVRLSLQSGAAALLLVMCLSLGCATTPAAPPATAPRISAEALATGIAEADRLAARGCYLCLKEAAAAYSTLLQLSEDGALRTKALENNLMIALREVELRIPDSGARDAARALEAGVASPYGAYFAVVDALGPAEAGDATRAGPANRLRSSYGGQEAGHYVPSRVLHEERRALATELEKEWPASAMKAYFYIAAALNAGLAELLTPQLDGIVAAHPQDLSLKYRLQAFRPTFSREASRALIGQEAGFGEVHLLLGMASVLVGQLADANRELTRAHQLLPDSTAIASALATVKMSYARYAEALALYEQVIAAWRDMAARLGKAKALSHLERHQDAIAMLDQLLLEDARSSPGEKYYWRAWNRLRLAQLQWAHDDAMSALNVMRNDAIYRLAGIASLRLAHVAEARGYFENALQMNPDDCDSLAYLAQIDSVERGPKPAFVRYSSAVACYDEQLAGMAAELARHEKDITGLSNGLIANLRAQIIEAQGLRAASVKHAERLRPSQSPIPNP